MERGSVSADEEPKAVPPAEAIEGFEVLVETAPPGLIRRFFTTHRHLAGLTLGALVASVREHEADPTLPRGPLFPFLRILAWMTRPFLDAKLVGAPFPIRFRRRLEILGPTYIKLGQVLALRQDLLPREITEELKNLLDRLPVVRFERFLELVEADLGRKVDTMFATIERQPLGSASIAQIHRARTLDGDDVILKVVKPGIREVLRRDAILLRIFGSLLQLVFARYQPKRVIAEFTEYTAREVDLRREADNAETFHANFKDLPDVVFPRIYRQYSGRSVLCMEFLDGFKPGDAATRALSEAERDHLIDLGAASVIRMIYQDGFFHADLHPANLLILRGPRCGFIDLGMVGRFDESLRRLLLYYFYCLVTGDSENAARYLGGVAQPGPGADPAGFRREVEEISRRWIHRSTFEGFSLAQLILQSVGMAGQYRMYFPVELILMVKALVTFEAVGQMLKPGFDVAEVSRKHVNRIFLRQFSPFRMARESFKGAPDIVDAFVKAPMLVTEGLRYLEKFTRQPAENPLSGLRGTMLAGFSAVAGSILVAFGGPWWLAGVFFLLTVILALRRGS